MTDLINIQELNRVYFENLKRLIDAGGVLKMDLANKARVFAAIEAKLRKTNQMTQTSLADLFKSHRKFLDSCIAQFSSSGLPPQVEREIKSIILSLRKCNVDISVVAQHIQHTVNLLFSLSLSSSSAPVYLSRLSVPQKKPSFFYFDQRREFDFAVSEEVKSVQESLTKLHSESDALLEPRLGTGVCVSQLFKILESYQKNRSDFQEEITRSEKEKPFFLFRWFFNKTMRAIHVWQEELLLGQYQSVEFQLLAIKRFLTLAQSHLAESDIQQVQERFNQVKREYELIKPSRNFSIDAIRARIEDECGLIQEVFGELNRDKGISLALPVVSGVAGPSQSDVAASRSEPELSQADRSAIEDEEEFLRNYAGADNELRDCIEVLIARAKRVYWKAAWCIEEDSEVGEIAKKLADKRISVREQYNPEEIFDSILALSQIQNKEPEESSCLQMRGF